MVILSIQEGLEKKIISFLATFQKSEEDLIGLVFVVQFIRDGYQIFQFPKGSQEVLVFLDNIVFCLLFFYRFLSLFTVIPKARLCGQLAKGSALFL